MGPDISMEDVTATGEEDNEVDPFLAFIDYAKSVLSGEQDEDDEEAVDYCNSIAPPGWSWIVSRILKTCAAYSSGVTAAILLSDLSQAYGEQRRTGAPTRRRPEFMNGLKNRHTRAKLPNTITIDSIFQKNFLALSSVLEAVVLDAFLLPGTNIFMLTLGDYWSFNTIDLYLHRRHYALVEYNGLLKKGREIFLTGCYLRTATEGSGCPRLLPTEYLVILLDEEQDDDAMLLGAQFCSDSFSSISLEVSSTGVSFSLYARIDHIGPLEIQGNLGSLRRKQITLVDNDGVKLQLLLWGEQVLLANLFSVGSMLALDKPFIASSSESGVETCEEHCLECGSETQLYLVPYIQHEEQVCVGLTPNKTQGLKHDPTQCTKVSQVTLPCDSQGTVDFSNYPFQSSVIDLRDKMTSISLYGVVTNIVREHTPEVIFALRIKDITGSIVAKLHFSTSWSIGRLGIGHTVYISGLTCSLTKKKKLEVLWFQDEAGASIVNLSCLPALLNSSCLQNLLRLSDLSSQTNRTRICEIWLDQVEYCHTRFSHSQCGHFVEETSSGCVECKFCLSTCSDEEVVRSFHLKVTVADESAKIFAWCTTQTASELLQISPDEFYHLPEEEQVMYPSSLENEKFMVAIVNCNRQVYGVNDGMSFEDDAVIWEITRALKCEL